MRELNSRELHGVSGGDWSIELNGGVIKVVLEGNESVQDMAGAVGSIASDAYWTARDATADFYQWIANGWAYSASCGH